MVKLNVATIEAARKFTGGGGDTKSLAKLKQGITQMQKSFQRGVVQLSKDHNDKLIMMPEGENKRVAERVLGYPVFTGDDYIRRMSMFKTKGRS